jgi:eukaryotic-like serine/threonine-protein kinase
MAELGSEFAGRYLIEAELGRGGMGVVYRALDRQLERPVALKVLLEESADRPEFRTRFQREIAVAASLPHPYIVPVYEGDFADGQFYFTMELVDGSDLELICAAGTLDPERAVKLLLQVCAALQFIHEKGHVHRDVKPTNVLVWQPGNPYETVKLTDFGIARTLADDSGLTKFQPGTPPYQSPEGVEHREQTPLSDQYSLGIMAFELLCGQRPFAKDRLPRAHIEDPVPPLAELAPGLPEHVCAAVARALEKDPADRFADVEAFATALGTDPSPRPEPVEPEPASAPLQEEIVAILGTTGERWVQLEEIARAVNERGRCPGPVTAADVERRTNLYSERFRRRGAAVQMR